MSIADLRRDYHRDSLDRSGLAKGPIDQFKSWFDQAAGFRGGRFRRFAIDLFKAFQNLLTGKSLEANAMALATAGADGKPSVRMVLLKGVDERGFTFFTNYQSRKGQELDANPHAALVFYWPQLERQVCVTGEISRLSPEESQQYFRSRPRGSRIAAWASPQSAIIADRAALESRVRQIESEYEGMDIPLPPFWGGYLLKPHRVEFWQGRPSRLHDRFVYTRGAESDWNIQRLAP
jgi:pyridoxamine 5'-phosphate oxidase